MPVRERKRLRQRRRQRARGALGSWLEAFYFTERKRLPISCQDVAGGVTLFRNQSPSHNPPQLRRIEIGIAHRRPGTLKLWQRRPRHSDSLLQPPEVFRQPLESADEIDSNTPFFIQEECVLRAEVLIGFLVADGSNGHYKMRKRQFHRKSCRDSRRPAGGDSASARGFRQFNTCNLFI